MRMSDEQISNLIIKLENEIDIIRSPNWTDELGKEEVHDHLVEINAYKKVLNGG